MRSKKATSLLSSLSLLVVTAACGVVSPEGDIARPFAGPGWSDEDGVTIELPGSTVIVAATRLDVKDDDEAQALFDGHMEAMLAVLDEQEGLVGYSLRQNLFNNDRYMTMSVWASEEAMLGWVVGDVHGAAIADAAALGESGVTVMWEEDPANLPLAWDVVIEHLDTDGRPAY